MPWIRDQILSLGTPKNIKLVEHNKFIGGRYSVLSEVGLVPCFLMGLNIKGLRKFFSKKISNSFIAGGLGGGGCCTAGLRQRDAAARGGDPLVLFGRRAACGAR